MNIKVKIRKSFIFFYTIFKEYTHPRGTLIRNTIAYSILMALAPIVALITILSLYTLKTTDWLYDILIRFIPDTIVEALLQIGLQTSSIGYLPFLITIGVSYYTASRGFYAISLCFCNYDEDTIKKHNLMITLQSILSPILFIFLVLVTVFLNSVLHFFIPKLPLALNTIATLLLYHILCLIFFYMITYPKRKLRTIFPGASFFAMSLTCMSFLFFFYINHFTNYNDIYGSIASIIILLLSTRVISMLMHIGACINHTLIKQEKPTN